MVTPRHRSWAVRVGGTLCLVALLTLLAIRIFQERNAADSPQRVPTQETAPPTGQDESPTPPREPLQLRLPEEKILETVDLEERNFEVSSPHTTTANSPETPEKRSPSLGVEISDENVPILQYNFLSKGKEAEQADRLDQLDGITPEEDENSPS
jgi:hypothetical protein